MSVYEKPVILETNINYDIKRDKTEELINKDYVKKKKKNH